MRLLCAKLVGPDQTLCLELLNSNCRLENLTFKVQDRMTLSALFLGVELLVLKPNLERLVGAQSSQFLPVLITVSDHHLVSSGFLSVPAFCLMSHSLVVTISQILSFQIPQVVRKALLLDIIVRYANSLKEAEISQQTLREVLTPQVDGHVGQRKV